MKTLVLPNMLAAMLVLAMQPAPAHAQAPRTWVSAVGVDGGPCSRTAPCKTFAGAIVNTAPGGEISVLDPGGYGVVTITKSVTINGEGTLASILASGSNAININAAATDKVILRNLQLNGAGSGSFGVNVTSGNVIIEKCQITGFNVGFLGGVGVLVSASGSTVVDIKDTDISHSTHGVWVQTSSGFAVTTLDNVRINSATGFGVLAGGNAFVSVNRSYISKAGSAAVYTSSGTGVINVTDSHLTNNTVGVNAATSGSTIRLNNVSLFDNPTGLITAAGATIATANNNKAAGNGGALTTNGTISNF